MGTCKGVQCLLILGQSELLGFHSSQQERRPYHHFTNSLNEHSHLPCHCFPKSQLLLWASSACTGTQQSQGRPKLKLNLFGVLAWLPFNQTSSPHQCTQTHCYKGEGSLDTTAWTEMARVISACSCTSFKLSPNHEPWPVLIKK